MKGLKIILKYINCYYIIIAIMYYIVYINYH